MALRVSSVSRGLSWQTLLPFLEWLSGYGGLQVKKDLFSGLTVALVLIPQSMAYAQLAGLTAYYGLYAAFLPPNIAALFGSSRQLALKNETVVANRHQIRNLLFESVRTDSGVFCLYGKGA